MADKATISQLLAAPLDVEAEQLQTQHDRLKAKYEIRPIFSRHRRLRWGPSFFAEPMHGHFRFTKRVTVLMRADMQMRRLR
jgi:hypothetical protein